MSRHYPFLWKFRLLRAVKARGVKQNRRLLVAWARSEGGNAAFNPLNTTEPWASSTDYNAQGVQNYPSGAAGVAATATTLLNGRYPGLVSDLRNGGKTAEQIVGSRRAEIDTWGTNPQTILDVLASR